MLTPFYSLLDTKFTSLQESCYWARSLTFWEEVNFFSKDSTVGDPLSYRAHSLLNIA